MEMFLFLVYFFISNIDCVKGQYRSPEITEHPADLLVPRGEPATLNCHAEGRPKPTITWFKNGKPFRLKKEGTRHVLLENGDLFFLWVLQSKKEDDSGLYWCQATNSVGTIRSKNATVEIAVLKLAFSAVPEDARVAEGGTALLKCVPPKGHPPPVVIWTKDGNEIDPATEHRFKIVDKGNLVISGVRLLDSGKYVCKARNVYGTRETNPAQLSVLVPPHFVSTSAKTTGNAGSTIELVCRVGGDPPPEVFWERLSSGELPIERMIQEENGQVLRIRHATTQDEGTYTCRAENPVGSVKTNISLSIHSRPIIAVHPTKVKIGINGSASFECMTSGNPSPTTYWTHEGTGVVIGTGQTWGAGRVFVDSMNTLTISSVTKEDEGFYVCSAVGLAGSAFARAHLEVQSVDDMPPPLIALGAPNQTLPLNTEGEMPCEARGTPEPRITWYVGESPLQPSDRTSVTPFGLLRIERLKMSDTGTYICRAISESGITEWITSLTVAKPTNPNVAFFKMPSDTALPEPPSMVSIENINATSVTIGWKRGRPGSSPVLGYNVQMWSPDERGPWTTANTRPTTLSTHPIAALVSDLTANTRYIFVVRASNSHGLSRPSEVTQVIQTLTSAKHYELSLQEIRARIAVPSIRLLRAKSISPSAIAINWQFLVDASIIEGIYVRYRSVYSTLNKSGGDLSVETVYLHKTEISPPEQYIVTGLHPDTEYEVFLTPFYDSVEGQPSAAIRVVTQEGHPEVAPKSLRYEFLNETTAKISWDPIPKDMANGIITNYVVELMRSMDENRIQKNVSGDRIFAIVTGLHPGDLYHVTVTGVTTSGPGPISSPLKFALPKIKLPEPQPPASIDLPAVNSKTNQYLVIGIAAASIFLFLFLFTAIVFIFRNRKKHKSPSFFVTGSSKDPWCEYPDCWNDSCKSVTETGSATSNHNSQIKGNSMSHGFGTSASQQFCSKSHNDSFDNNGFYNIKPVEDLYEDPDGYKLVSFANYETKRRFSPEPYATTPLISESYLKGSIQAAKLNLPSKETENIQIVGGCATITAPDMCGSNARFINFHPQQIKDISAPILQFPPPPSIIPLEEQYSDNSLSVRCKGKNSFTRFLQQQLPYSLAGSSSGGSQKSHESPIVRPRLQRGNPRTGNPNNPTPYLDSETRLLQPQCLPALVEDTLNNCKSSKLLPASRIVNGSQRFNTHDSSIRNGTDCYSQPLNISADSPNSSVMGDAEESESDSYSYSSGCSSMPGVPRHQEQNFVESLRTAGEGRWGRGDNICCIDNELYKRPKNNQSSNKTNGDKKPLTPVKPYEHLLDVSALGYESVTSPLV